MQWSIFVRFLVSIVLQLTDVLSICPMDTTELPTCDDGPLVFANPSMPPDQLNQRTVRGSYSAMSCQAVNFCDITWLKDDGIPYPFNFLFGSSLGHQCLLEYNQFLEITNTQKDAIGNYTCYVSNSSHTIQRTFLLEVVDEAFNEGILPLKNNNCTNGTASQEEDVHIFCEFCVGDKTTQTNLQWYKKDEQGLTPVSSINLRDETDSSTWYLTSRECRKSCLTDYSGCTSVGEHLTIGHVTDDAYGTYVLIANYTLDGVIKKNSQTVVLSRPDGPITDLELTIIIVVSLAVAFFLMVALPATCYYHHLTFLLYWKNNYGAVEQQDGKHYDAFISYSDTDEDRKFVLYLRTLLHQHRYEVWVRDIDADTGTTLIAEEIDGMKDSRRCILVISPEYLQSRHSQVLTELAADQTLKQQSRIVPILYRNVTKEDIRGHRYLDRIVRVLPCITWEEIQDDDEEDGAEIGDVQGEGHVIENNEVHGIDEEEGRVIEDNEVHDIGEEERGGINRHGIELNGEIRMDDINVHAHQEERIRNEHMDDGQIQQMLLVGGADQAVENGHGPMAEVGMDEQDMVRVRMDADVNQVIVGVRPEIADDGIELLQAQNDGADVERDHENYINNDGWIHIGAGGDHRQPLDAREERERRKRKKQKRKCEKKILLKMPPKRPEL